MDPIERHAIEVEISKLNFLLENLFAMRFNDHGGSLADVDATSDDFCRQALLPPSVYGPDQDPEDIRRFQEMLSHRLAMFFAGVRKRVASAAK